MRPIITLFKWTVVPLTLVLSGGEVRADNRVLSLVWSRTMKVDDFGKDPKFVSSGFDSSGQVGGTFVWKASRDAPLVVYDPQQRKIVNEETLIGRWTYGGRNYKSPGAPRESWRDAFEALATLDRNRDSAVSGRELQVLSLWFDTNRDGQAQAGEVSPAASVGLAEISLRGNPQSTSDGSQYYRQGYRRYSAAGELWTGPSISWSIANTSSLTPTAMPSAAAVTSSSPAAVPWTPTSVPPTVVAPTKPPSTAVPTPQRATAGVEAPPRGAATDRDAPLDTAVAGVVSRSSNNGARFNGYWRWVNDFDAEPDQGTLQIEVLDDGSVKGSSVSELVLAENEPANKAARRVVVLEGRVNRNEKEEITFKMLDANQDASSVATIEERDGVLFLKGTTVATIVDPDGVRRETTYDWLAVKTDTHAVSGDIAGEARQNEHERRSHVQ